MKKRLFSLLLFSFLFVNSTLMAQECEPYFPMTEGTKMELVNYDKKDKKQSTNKQTVLSKTDVGGVLTFKAQSVVMDDKDKEVSTTEYEVKCEDGKFYVDISAIMINNEQMNGYQGMEMTVDGDFVEIPMNATAGQTLPDAQMIVTIGAAGGAGGIKMTINITDRKVEAIEDLTTGAGTFKCVKLSYTTMTKMGPLKVQASSIDWYSKNVGMVRQEVYRKNGKLSGYTVLEKFQ